MIAILSPAKNLDLDSPVTTKVVSQPVFESEAEQLMKGLKKKSNKKIADMMKLSDALASLNYERYQKWSLPFSSENARPAVLSFNGEVYNGLQAKSFSEEQAIYAQDHLRLLSGLHGVLKPYDLIQPYRLEMGTKFNPKRNQTNLYQFWGKKIAMKLNEDLEAQGDDVLVNLASNEYFKAVDRKILKANVITCHFKEAKGDDYKVVMVYAKKARGMMASYILNNKLKSVEELKSFDQDHYQFNEALSTDDEFTFTRNL